MSDAKRKYMVARTMSAAPVPTLSYLPQESLRTSARRCRRRPDFSVGVINSIRSAADAMGISLAELLAQTSPFMHGSTVVDNVIRTRDGARTGLITTQGFEDTVLIYARRLWPLGRPHRGPHQASGQDRTGAGAGGARLHLSACPSAQTTRCDSSRSLMKPLPKRQSGF